VPAAKAAGGGRGIGGAAGMRLHAGHGLNYRNVRPVANIACMRERTIGHAIICRAVFVGLRQGGGEMKTVINERNKPHATCASTPP